MSQDRKPLPPQTAHKAWAAAGGALLGNAILAGVLALTRWLLGEPIPIDPETAGAVYTLATAAVTAAGAWLGAFLKRNWQIAAGSAGLRCHALPVLAAVGLALMLSGGSCATTAQKAFPRTAAGWESGGITGAIGGAAEGVLVGCRTLDGATVLVDATAQLAGVTTTVEAIRAARQSACLAAGLLAPLAPEVAPAPPVRP